MSSDVVVGYDGKPRCAWAGAGDSAFGRYHDEGWGIRTYDEATMFEALTLGVFEVGLSWSIVFGKRDAFRTAFRGPRRRALRRSRGPTRATASVRRGRSQPSPLSTPWRTRSPSS